MRAIKLTLSFVHIANLFTYGANEEAEGFYKKNSARFKGPIILLPGPVRSSRRIISAV
jgi:hypothetical protein